MENYFWIMIAIAVISTIMCHVATKRSFVNPMKKLRNGSIWKVYAGPKEVKVDPQVNQKFYLFQDKTKSGWVDVARPADLLIDKIEKATNINTDEIRCENGRNIYYQKA